MFENSPVRPPAEPIRLMIILGSVRPQRVGLHVALWAHELVTQAPGIEIDFVDLAELHLPFMDEPSHPEHQQYTKAHTRAWSARVGAADAFLVISPEYNNSYSPALKNAIDFLHHEWAGKPMGFISYGGPAGGTRGVAALRPVLDSLQLVSTRANVAIPYVTAQIADDYFVPFESQLVELRQLLTELRSHTPAVHTDNRSRIYAIT